MLRAYGKKEFGVKESHVQYVTDTSKWDCSVTRGDRENREMLFERHHRRNYRETFDR